VWPEDASVNIRIVTASAGSGKTYKLTSILDDEIAARRVRPEGVVAVTFTKQAAAELVERARSKLLASGRGLEAHRLLAARIGTVNSVCGALVTEFAFELGLSPGLRVLDEEAAELEFDRTVGRVVTTQLADELERYKHVFENDLDWRHEVRRIVEAARANNLAPEQLLACADRSKRDLDAILGPVAKTDLDRALETALHDAISGLEPHVDDYKVTATYVDFCRQARRDLGRNALRWGDWAKLAKDGPSKKVDEHAEPVREVAEQHGAHPRLRADLHTLIDKVFDVANRALSTYQEHKRALGVIDFVDQESLALRLLRMPDVKEALAGLIDLFLVDEFQDTSPIQLAVFLELAALAKDSIWVGDPKQAIYGFRGTDPVLMDAAIESLTSVSSDGDLVAAAAAAVSKGKVETLDTSYRSRPALVTLTSEIFARAFEHQGMPAERTRLKPKLEVEPPGLGDIVQTWPLQAKNAEHRAAAAAAGVRDLIVRRSQVRGTDGAPRAATPKDVAVLCRTNAQCREIAVALGELGVAAVVPRVGLTDTHEAMVALAGLALWADPGDAIAAAELARIISFPENLDGFVARVIEVPGDKAFAEEPTVARVIATRSQDRDAGPLAALDAVLGATQLRQLCAEWGDSAQRLANLDALRAHAVSYVERASAAGDAATIVGLLGYLEELASQGTWRDQRTDSQALLADGDAVTVSTWHAAKGLEWPVTVLYGLESLRAASSWGVHVLSDAVTFDMTNPLGGRWIRFWPFPYTRTNQLGCVCEAVAASPGHRQLSERAAREALRVLYVGWTRARDRLVLAAAPKKLLDGILGTLIEIDASLIVEPRADLRANVRVTWATVAVDVVVAPIGPAAPEQATRTAGMITVGNPPLERALARRIPSDLDSVPSTLGEVIDLGPRLAVRGSPDMEHLGHAVHGFFAADRPGLTEPDRLALVEQLLASFGLPGCLDPREVVFAATRFWSWCDVRFAGSRIHREWPIAHRRESGSIIAGTADLVLSTSDAFVLVDHKSFPGAADAASVRALGYAGQLDAYARGIAAATRRRCVSSWIHFPVIGKLVEVRFGA
jgi:ATP-dependent exoDNAse (exonuclease V) beta subunit